MATQPTGTVTFLFTDIEGSTRLWEQDASAMREVLARHDVIVREHISDNGGYVFTTAGDAFSAAFSDPLAAVEAAIAAQQALSAEQWTFGEIRVRMSLHAGVAHERDGDYFGPTLNRTARILSAGHGGQVLVSQAARDLLTGRLPAGAGLKHLGEYRLKDLGSPEHLHQLTHPDLDREFPALRTLDAHLNNLPIELSSFIGRHEELTETVKRLRDSRLVTLTGVGGSGKTRLALQTAAEMFDEFTDGVWVAEMAGLAEPERFPHWVAEEMEVAGSSQTGLSGGSGDRSWMEVLVDYLAPRTALLVLDNCEHLISAAAEFTDRVLRACPDLKILTTSREGLGIRGEYLIQVPSMRLPSAFGVDDDAGYPDAMQLFAERARAVNARFSLNGETAPSVADICRRLDGMPLAIELAAARVRMLPVDQIALRLGDAFRLLTGGSRTALPRQQTLLATVDWSYRLLDDRERLVFDRLAVFRSGFSLEAAEAIVSGDGVDEFDVFDILASLIDKSMVQGGSDSGRFGLLETLRQFALGKLTDAGSGDLWRERHAQYFAVVADEAFEGTRGRDQVEWLERIDRDQDNLDAAITWAIESGRYELAARIAAGVWFAWGSAQRQKQGLELMHQIADHLDGMDPGLLVRFLVGRSWLWSLSTTTSQGRPDAERALVLAEGTGDPRLRGLAQMVLAVADHQEFEYDRALEEYGVAFRLFEEAGDEWGMGWTTVWPGWIRRMQADIDGATEWLEKAKRHFRAAGTSVGLGWTLTTLAIMRRYAEDYDEAIRLHAEASDLFGAAGERGAVSFNLLCSAIALRLAGRSDEALGPARRAMSIERDLGTQSGESAAVFSAIQRAAGDLRGAVATMQEARPRFASETAAPLTVIADELADLAVAVGMYEVAARLVGFAAAERIRIDRPIPAPYRAERDRTAAAIAEHVPDHEAIRAAWADRDKDEVVALLGDVLDDVEAALESSRT